MYWHANSACKSRYLYPDGRLVATQANGQVCVLQLYEGSQKCSLTIDNTPRSTP